MSNHSMSDMAFYINFILIGFAVLATLLLLINLAISVLRSVARRHAARTDLDQIGREAIVIKTIRPGKPGQVRYRTDEGYRQAVAAADSAIRNGNTVIIQAVIQNRFHVRLPSSEERSGQPLSHQPARPSADQTDRAAEDAATAVQQRHVTAGRDS